MKTEQIILTPQIAEHLLQTSENNRTVKSVNVNNIANDITNGRWQLNGESIKLDTSGRLIDGQHRCLGVIKAQKPVATLLVTDLSPENYKTIDMRCVKRSLPDILSMKGRKNTLHTAAIANSLYGILYQTLPYTPERFGYPSLSFDMAERIIKHFEIEKNYENSKKGALDFRGSGLTTTMLVAMKCVTRKISESKSDMFMNQLQTGADLPRNSPVFLLRTRVIREAVAKTKLSPKEMWALLIKTWNYCYDDVRRKTLRWNKEELFPSISGLESSEIDWALLSDLVKKNSKNARG